MPYTICVGSSYRCLQTVETIRASMLPETQAVPGYGLDGHCAFP